MGVKKHSDWRHGRRPEHKLQIEKAKKGNRLITFQLGGQQSAIKLFRHQAPKAFPYIRFEVPSYMGVEPIPGSGSDWKAPDLVCWYAVRLFIKRTRDARAELAKLFNYLHTAARVEGSYIALPRIPAGFGKERRTAREKDLRPRRTVC